MSVSRLVQNATKAPKGVTDLHSASFVSDDSLVGIKAECKKDDSTVRDVARYLLLDLTNKSTIVRLRSLSIINSLFLRSKEFRKEINSHIRSIVECAGFLSAKNVENVEHRELLELRVKELLESWDCYYGEFLPEIRALTRHMKEFLRLDMPNIQASLFIKYHTAF
jgi:hypothetical protein